MNFNEYQEWTATTVKYPEGSKERELAYLALGLAGETGEVAEKIKKFLRGDIENDIDARADLHLTLLMELGDVLWYLSRLSAVMGIPLDVVAAYNQLKLETRMRDGTIKGDGDER